MTAKRRSTVAPTAEPPKKAAVPSSWKREGAADDSSCALSFPPELVASIFSFWRARDLMKLFLSASHQKPASCAGGAGDGLLMPILIATLFERQRQVTTRHLQALVRQEDALFFLKDFEAAFQDLGDVAKKEETTLVVVAAAANKCCAMLGLVEVWCLKDRLAKSSTVIGHCLASRASKSRSLSFVKKDLSCRMDSLLAELVSMNEPKLADFVQEVFQGLETPNETLFVAAAKKCCVILEYWQVVMVANLPSRDAPQAEKGRRILWPVGFGNLKVDAHVNDNHTRIQNTVLVSSPLPWNPSVIHQLHEWLEHGVPCSPFVRNRTRPWHKYMGVVTLVPSSNHHRHRRGNNNNDDNDSWLFEHVDRTCGVGGLCPALHVRGVLLMLITRGFATKATGTNLHQVLADESEHAWLLDEKVDGKNFFISWGWGENVFRDEGPYTVDTVLGVMEQITTHCRRRIGEPFHK